MKYETRKCNYCGKSAGGNYIKSYTLIGKFGYVQGVAELSILLCITKIF